MADATVRPFINLPGISERVSVETYISALKVSHPNFESWYSKIYTLAKQSGEDNDNLDIWDIKFGKQGKILRDFLVEVGISQENKAKYTVLVKYIEFILERAHGTDLLAEDEEDIFKAVQGFMPEKDTETLNHAMRVAKHLLT